MTEHRIVNHCWGLYFTNYRNEGLRQVDCRRLPLYEVTYRARGMGGTLPLCQSCLNEYQNDPAVQVDNIDDILWEETGTPVRTGEAIMSVVEHRRKTDA